MADTQVDTTATTPTGNIKLHKSTDPISPTEVITKLIKMFPKASVGTLTKLSAGVKTYGDIESKDFELKAMDIVPLEEKNVLSGEVSFGPVKGGLKSLVSLARAFGAKGAAKTAAKTVAASASTEGAALKAAAEAGDETAQAVITMLESGQDVAALEKAGKLKGASKAVLKYVAAHKKSTAAGVLITWAAAENKFGGNDKPKADVSTTIDPMNPDATEVPEDTAMPGATPAPTPKASKTPTPTPTPSMTPSMKPTPSATPSVKPTPSMTSTAKPTPSATATPGATPSATPAASGNWMADLAPKNYGEWLKAFPYGDTAKLKQFYDYGVKANLFGPDASIANGKIQKGWQNLGKLSIQSKTYTPWQMLTVASGMSTSGGANKTTVNETISYTDATDVESLLNKQLLALTGKTADAKLLKKFLADVKAAESKRGTKTTTTTVDGKSRSVVTPGYTQNDILADAEKIAQQDPMYKQLQSSNVFGDALSQALGLK